MPRGMMGWRDTRAGEEERVITEVRSLRRAGARDRDSGGLTRRSCHLQTRGCQSKWVHVGPWPERLKPSSPDGIFSLLLLTPKGVTDGGTWCGRGCDML